MTPTREQLASIEAELSDCASMLSTVVDTIDGDYCEHRTGPMVQIVMERLRTLAAACLAAPPPEPQAMPPIEKGDVVKFADGRLLEITTPAWPPDAVWPLLAHYKPVWTREPRR